MSEDEFKQLELLLGKLMAHFECRYCIVPGCVIDGFHIALYDGRGNPMRQAIGATLFKVASELKNN